MAVKYTRTPYLVVFQEKSGFKDTYAGQIGTVALECMYLKPETPSDTCVIMMHPIGGSSYLPLPGALARIGVHVLYCNSRYRGIDYSLIMEKVALDLGACVRDARERLGYKKVVLGGWSGGGGLSLFYQAQAESPSITHTPAGDPCDLVGANLIPADGMILMAAHLSRNLTLTEWLDPSITDESKPYDRDPSLNIYDPDGPKAPFGAEFVAKYRAAQIARNRRITAWVKQELKALKDKGEENMEKCFLVQGTLADPRFLDPALEPNGRKPYWSFLGDPKIVNESPVGIARYSSLRSWLSQWSYDDSNADGLKCAAKLKRPLLVMENGADDAVPPSHPKKLLAAAKDVPNKQHYVVEGADHYYFGQPEKAAESAKVCAEWMAGNV